MAGFYRLRYTLRHNDQHITDYTARLLEWLSEQFVQSAIKSGSLYIIMSKANTVCSYNFMCVYVCIMSPMSGSKVIRESDHARRESLSNKRKSYKAEDHPLPDSDLQT